MGLMDKIWEEVFVGQHQPPQPHQPHPQPVLQPNHHHQQQQQQQQQNAQSRPRPIINVPRLKVDEPLGVPNSPTSNLDRSDSTSSPSPSPKGHSSDSGGRRKSDVFAESQSVGPGVNQSVGPGMSQSINIPSGRKRLDSSRSLPTGFRYIPELISPGSRKGESVWRNVFDPGSNNSKALDRMGSVKMDRTDQKAPAVYDWYNPLNI